VNCRVGIPVLPEIATLATWARTVGVNRTRGCAVIPVTLRYLSVR